MTKSWQEKKNVTLLQHMWGLTKRRLQLHFRCVTGPQVDVENTMADRQADCGTQPALQHLWWRRAPPNERWEEEEFVAKIVKIRRETTPCDDALHVVWPGPVDFLRKDPVLHAQHPNPW